MTARAHVVLAAAVLSFSGAISLDGSAAAAGCPPLQYLAEVARLRTELAATPPQADAARQTLVRMQAAGAADPVVLEPIIADLDADPAGSGDALRRVDAITDALHLPPRATCNVDSKAALNTLHDVYASPVFANLDQKQQASWLTTVLDALASFLGRITGTLGAAWTVLIAALLLSAMLTFAVLRLRGARGRRERASVFEEGLPSDDPEVEWTRAERAAGSRDFRNAIRHAFRSALLDVAVRGGVHVDAAWTTRELLSALQNDTELVEALRPAAAVFDHAWYSGSDTGQAEWETARRECGRVRSMSAAHRRRETAA